MMQCIEKNAHCTLHENKSQWEIFEQMRNMVNFISLSISLVAVWISRFKRGEPEG